MNIQNLTIAKIKHGLEKKEFSAFELAKAFFEHIRKKEKDINAFIEITEESALRVAQIIDEKNIRGEELPILAGVPCSVKDAILVKNIRCTAGSKILEQYIASYDATVVTKLKTAGALIVGKTNMDEFGMGGSTENSAFGVVKNPHDFSRVAGGSSGGSAASVAANEAVISLGEDTGGSVRLPASFCGVVGLKPTYGVVSRNGIISLASSFDQVGPFAKTVEDVEILFNVIKGKDPADSTSVESEIRNSKFEIRNLRIGLPKEYFTKGLDSEVEKIIRQAIKKLEDQGAHVEEIELPRVPFALAVYYIINTSEASSNLARYDGIRYGKSDAFAPTLLDTYIKTRGKEFGVEVKRRIMLGTYALSAGYYDAYYLKAQKIRELLKQDFETAFKKVDVIAGPVSPFLPFTIGEKAQDPLVMYLVDMYTVPANLTGLPAISIPAGKVGNLPVGLQLMGPAWSENLLFETGKTLEKLMV